MASNTQRRSAWESAATIRGRNPNLWRKDASGKVMYKPAYGTRGRYGWVVASRPGGARGGVRAVQSGGMKMAAVRKAKKSPARKMAKPAKKAATKSTRKPARKTAKKATKRTAKKA